MKVNELINILEDMDQDANIWIIAQRDYPFETKITGICQRGDWVEEDEVDEDAPDVDSNRWNANEEQLPRSDVFIVQGEQVRYGARAAWDAARRY